MHLDDGLHQLDNLFKTERLSCSLGLEEILFGNIEMSAQSVSGMGCLGVRGLNSTYPSMTGAASESMRARPIS